MYILAFFYNFTLIKYVFIATIYYLNKFINSSRVLA